MCSRSMHFMIGKRTRGSKAAKIILAKRKRSKKLRKLVKPLQGRDRETRPIRGAILRTYPSLGYAASHPALNNAAARTIEILRYLPGSLPIVFSFKIVDIKIILR